MIRYRVAGRWAAVLVAAVATGVAPVPTAAAAPASAVRAAAPTESVIDTSTWPIHNVANGDCIVARGTTGEAAVVKTGCSLDYVDQFWSLEPVTDRDYYQVKNANSGQCLLVRGNQSETPAVQTTCADYADQQWQIVEDAAGRTFMLKNRNSGMCLVMRNSQSDARQVGCDGQYADQWWQRGMPSAPNRSVYLRKPVYLVHGYNVDGASLNIKGSYFSGLIDSLSDCSTASHRGSLCFQGSIARAWAYCYYSNDTNCDLLTPGDRNRPIKDIGADLAWEIYDHFSKFNVPVDVAAHSMGGLVIKAALTGVAKHDPAFPPYLFVEDVVTLSTPHTSIPLASVCQFQQCVDMRTDSGFRQWVQPTPQSAMGTSWSLIGADDDLTVPADRAVPSSITSVFEKVVYTGDQLLPKAYAHMGILDAVSETKTYSLDICDYWYDCSMSDRGTFERITTGASPGRMTKEFLSGSDDD